MRRRANEIFSLENLTQLTLFGVGILVALSVGYPQFFPQFTRGGNCANLPHPPGGNQRSILQYNDDFQDLAIEVVIDNADFTNSEYVLSPNEPFTVQVIFRNNDVGPVYLFYERDSVVDYDRILTAEATLTTSAPGLYLIFFDRFAEIDPPVQGPLETPQQSYSLQDLYVLQSRQSCNVRIEVDPSDDPENKIINFTPGETYRVVAYYQNQDPGIFPAPELVPTATAIPGLTDTLGVWNGGRIWSEPVRLIFPQ
ncbi:MAG: hypothetical protein L0154_20065 [Chloroflexi bacterium]|nr:hypothetical protein [Chloroflexota bacterium]